MTRVVLRGGPVITCDPAGRVAEALCFDEDDSRILAVGTVAEVRAAAGEGARDVDLDGATVLPGLIDTHPHLMHFGVLTEPLVDLGDTTDHADILTRIGTRAQTTPPGEWIMTTPVGEPHYFLRRSWRDLTEGELPTRHVLDRATPEHPVVIQAWAPTTPNVMACNSLALDRLDITAATPDHVGRVHVEKDPAGHPTGRLFGSVNNYYANDPFTEVLYRRLPILQPTAIGPGTERAMRTYNAMGVTTVYEGHAMDFPMIAAYQWLRDQNRLTVRVLCCPEAQPYGLPGTGPLDDDQFAWRLHHALTLVEHTDDLLRVDGLTVGRGGPIGPGLILMRDPYLDPYGEPTTGRSFVTRARVQQAMRFAHENRLRLNIVTAGTAETDQHLDDLEHLASRGPLAADGLPWLLQHLYFAEPAHARRIAALGLDVTTSTSFSWGKGELVRQRMGEQLLEYLIPLRRLLDAGIHVACGTDWGPKNVFEHLALAVEPTYASGRPAATPGVTRQEALAMWTRQAARVLRWPGIGTLRPGHHADLCIIDRNPLRCPLDDLPHTRIHTTLLAGRPVHGTL